MATTEELHDSLNSFADTCKQNVRLTAMIKDWNRVMNVTATDLTTCYSLTTLNGDVVVGAGANTSADLNIESTSDLLTQVFYGELSPNEPYNDGSLKIHGAEADIVRLDFVIAMLWD